MENKSRKIAWLTSLPSPYWIPVWDELALKNSLKLFFTNGVENARGWKIPSDPIWKHHVFSKKILYFGEAQVIPNPMGFRKITIRNEIVVIGGGWEVPIHVLTMAYARLKRKKVFIISESVIESHRYTGKFVRKIRFIVFKLATKIITVGERSTLSVLETGISKNKIIELFNPVDVQFFNDKGNETQRNTSLGHMFIAAGRLIKLKNFESIIKAFKNIANPQDVLTIAGDGPLRNTLENLAVEIQIQNQVKFIGHLSQIEIAKLYSQSHTLVLASTNEVWGMVATEALSAGCQVIVSRNCGVSNFIEKMSGVYICETDVASIATSMRKSRNEFRGKNLKPEILQFTPKKFVDNLSIIFSNEY
jgi:glycosyltransferase involved in cell wall biosynthesis